MIYSMVARRYTGEDAHDRRTVASELCAHHEYQETTLSHLLPISFQTTRHTETQYKLQNSVFDVISDVLAQRTVEGIRRNKSEIINVSRVSTAH
jgi:hypothetical protein